MTAPGDGPPNGDDIEPADADGTDESDTRTTGEHFFGSLIDQPVGASASAARRIADLTSQIDFLDLEVSRYRELLEADRIRHAKQIAEVTLEADARFDDLRRHEREQNDATHASYRRLLAERQLEFEQHLSKNVADHAYELALERQRHEEILEHERTRRDVQLEANRKQLVDELNESHQRVRQTLVNEAGQAKETVARLQVEIDDWTQRAKVAEATLKEQTVELTLLRGRVETAENQRTTQVGDLEEQLAVAHQRVQAERKRSAATLAELLERSAAIAAEADKARADYAAQQAIADHAAAVAHKRAQSEYAALAQAADERTERASMREAELEAAIAELRAELDH